MPFLDLSSWPSSFSVKEGLVMEEPVSTIHSKSSGKGRVGLGTRAWRAFLGWVPLR